MKKERFNLIAFRSSQDAIRAEKELKLAEINMRIIPLPKEISSDCGLSIKFDLNKLNQVRELLNSKNIDVFAYYYITKIGLKKEITKI